MVEADCFQLRFIIITTANVNDVNIDNRMLIAKLIKKQFKLLMSVIAQRYIVTARRAVLIMRGMTENLFTCS